MATQEAPNATTSKSRTRMVFVGLIAVFVSPIFIAWLYTAGYLEFGTVSHTNRGSLINPPIDLREDETTQGLFDRANLAPGEWLLLLLPPPECSEACGEAIQRLTTIRSLLGYSGQRVNILSLSTLDKSEGVSIPEAKLLIDKAAHSKLTLLLSKAAPAVELPQILFLDWRKQIVLRFDADAPSIDVKKDLKRLLRASKIR